MSAEVPSVLLKIAGRKREEVKLAVSNRRHHDRIIALAERSPPTRNFYGAISKRGEINIIAEHKRTSPSRERAGKGVFRPGAMMADIVRTYEEAGASAISILTDRGFDGYLDDLSQAREIVHLPLLRKDFIVDPYQIYEARAFGANAILLIASLLDELQLHDSITLAKMLKMDCLVESHTPGELEKSLVAGAKIIGINSRNLHDFSVSLDSFVNLAKYVPLGKPIVAESGIFTYDDVRRVQDAGASAILVGTSLMDREVCPTYGDIERKIRELKGN